MDINSFLNLDKDQKLEQLEKWLKYSNYESLVSCFADHDINITSRIYEMCLSTGKPVINSLIEATNSKNVDVRSWAFTTLGQMDSVNLKVLWVILKHVFADPNFYVKRKARHALMDVIKVLTKKSLLILDYFLYFIIISIVQLVTLMFILLPLVIISSDELTGQGVIYRDLLAVFSMVSIIPLLSGFIIVSLTKSNKQGYFAAASLGFIQSIPYNIFLTLALKKIGIINVFVQMFGLFGGIVGLYVLYMLSKNTKKETVIPIESDIEEQGLTAIRLIRERVKFSKRFLDIVAGLGGFIGIVLVGYLCVSIYNISAISTNQKDMNQIKDEVSLPSIDSEFFKSLEQPDK